MPKKLHVSLTKPCTENWNSMTPTEQGRHCQVCEKQVVDFTQMSDQEIIRYFKTYNNLCGRMRPDQVNRNYTLPTTPSGSKKWLMAGLFTGLILSQHTPTQAINKQNQPTTLIQQQLHLVQSDSNAVSKNEAWSIKGQVIDEEGQEVLGATVYVKESKDSGNSIIVSTTNEEGKFLLDIPKGYESVTLVFSYVGFDTQEHAVQNTYNQALQVTLKYDTMVLGGLEVHYPPKKFSPKWFWHQIKRFPKWLISPFQKGKKDCSH